LGSPIALYPEVLLFLAKLFMDMQQRDQAAKDKKDKKKGAKSK
jgi:hypothetical protein